MKSVCVLFFLIFPSFAFANQVNSSLIERAGFTVNSANSYDGLSFNGFAPFEGFLSNSSFQLGSFSLPTNVNLEFTLLSEVAAFDGNQGVGANNFGVFDKNGNFISLIDSAIVNPGFATSFASLDASDNYSFGMVNPVGTFHADDSKNFGDRAQLIAYQIDKDGTLFIDKPDLLGITSALTFNLMAGDVIIFIEDLFEQNTGLFAGLFGPGDFDYDDMIILVRQSQIPEPASMMLLGSGMIGLRLLKRRKNSIKS